ncbi:MAG: GNAT family N-acetyltransferase [Pseudomonadota bacterium]
MAFIDDLVFQFEDNETGGQFTAHDAEGQRAELTFSKAGEKLIIADHTGVPDAFRGKGVGQALVERLVSYVREEKKNLVPLCPFVKAQLKRHPEWQDVLES